MAQITVTYHDGHRFSGETYEEVMEKIWASSYDIRADSLPEYMERMSARIKLLTHVTIAPDAQSLLEGQALLGILILAKGNVLTYPSEMDHES